MKYFLIFLCGISIFLTSCVLTPGEKFLQQGQVAYQRQDYHQAFILLLTSARYDNTTAQYAVGYMYYYGIGTKRNVLTAVKWFKKAARYREPESIKALEIINHSGPPMFTFGRPYDVLNPKPTTKINTDP